MEKNMSATKLHLEKLGKLQKKSFNNWDCQCPGCTERAINSHLLQQHGVLDNASKSHKFREVRYSYPTYWNTEKPNYEFKSVGINDAISYPVFCSKHDRELFRAIEVDTPDLDNYKNQLLYCFRTLCGEIRKIEVTMKQWVMIKDDTELSKNIRCPNPEDFEQRIRNGLHYGTFLRRYKDEIIQEMNHPRKKFYFKHYSYPKLDVYSSAVIGHDNTIYLNDGIMNKQALCFIHVIPLKDTLEILIGYHKDYSSLFYKQYTELWRGLNETSLGIMLTDLFVNKIENFGLSEELYNQIPESNKLRFIEFKSQYGIEEHPVNFNLFSNLE